MTREKEDYENLSDCRLEELTNCGTSKTKRYKYIHTCVFPSMM